MEPSQCARQSELLLRGAGEVRLLELTTYGDAHLHAGCRRHHHVSIKLPFISCCLPKLGKSGRNQCR